MIVVLDTNVLIQALNPRNTLAIILQAWHTRKFAWAVSTEMLLEYQEIVTRQSGLARWQMLERLLDVAAVHQGNLLHVSPSYQFRTISADRDDDKFADCAIAAEADFIITKDAHFNALIGSGYKPQPITPEEFIARHLTPAS